MKEQKKSSSLKSAKLKVILFHFLVFPEFLCNNIETIQCEKKVTWRKSCVNVTLSHLKFIEN